MVIHQVLSMATLIYMSKDKHMFETQLMRFAEVVSEFLLLSSSLLIQQCIRIDYDDEVRSALTIAIFVAIGALTTLNVSLII